ncbi:MAG: FG-GAP repeat protein [Blastocatellia bacterium]|nr:FG-GAP repeat protein [Blastocatellia bacterium]MBK6425401.1 FG-GAP repeat protein [Blastocatellia bacterium]
MNTRRIALTLALVTSLAAGLPATSPAAASGTPLISLAIDPMASGERSDYNGDLIDDLVVGSPGENIGVPPFTFPIEDAGQINAIYGTTSFLSSTGNQAFDMRDIGVTGSPRDFDNFGAALASGDFNGDGYSDLAIGAPHPDEIQTPFGGRVSIFYGDAGGLDRDADQIFSQDTDNMLDVGEFGDQFGFCLAAGDFNADAKTDLAIAVPFERVGGEAGVDHGAVAVLYGSPSGLSTINNQLWSQSSPGIADNLESGDRFGHGLATGDFNGDFVSDLAIGAPFEDNGQTPDEGTVHVIFGQASVGLTATGSRQLQRRTKIVAGLPDSTGYQFGSALAAGDTNGDGFDDLAVGLPGDDTSGAIDSGSVMLFIGSATGAFTRFATVIHEDLSGIQGVAEAGDRFGETLTIGKLGADAFEDLVIGAPGDRVGSQDGAGSVHVFMSKFFGVDLGDQMVLTQSFIQSGAPEAGDAFGASLSNGDYNGDGFDDLAIGVPLEDIDSDTDCGAVHVVYSSLSGPITDQDVQLWSQGTSGIDGTRRSNERFGTAVR